ncbi:MAG: thioredoxin-dependent thiol peroxidase [Chitinophagaceae bacterium]|nr:thioredoxin-dependent thiol peroxidase [Chitinophagaceae bacterium]
MAELKEGDKAPVFEARDQNGDIISLEKMKGKKVVLYFYPKDDTPGCTAEACNLRDNYAALKKAGYEVVGVSPDNEVSHLKFKKKHELPFHLIPDPGKEIINKYGVWGQKNMYGVKFMGLKRTTFLIDEDGIIFKIFRRPQTKKHGEEILEVQSPGS